MAMRMCDLLVAAETGGASKPKVMDDLRPVVGIRSALESEETRQVGHRGVLRRVDRPHALDAVGAGEVDQVCHEDHAQAFVLPIVEYGHRAFAGTPLRRGAVST